MKLYYAAKESQAVDTPETPDLVTDLPPPTSDTIETPEEPCLNKPFVATQQTNRVNTPEEPVLLSSLKKYPGSYPGPTCIESKENYNPTTIIQDDYNFKLPNAHTVKKLKSRENSFTADANGQKKQKSRENSFTLDSSISNHHRRSNVRKSFASADDSLYLSDNLSFDARDRKKACDNSFSQAMLQYNHIPASPMPPPKGNH